MLARLSKLLLSFIACFLLLITFTKPAFAQVATPSASLTNQTYSPQSPQFSNILVINLIHTFSCFAEGRSVIGQPCVTLQPQDNNKQSMLPQIKTLAQDQGALGAANNFMGNVYDTPPAQISEYLAFESKNLGIAPSAYAASDVSGSGNEVLQPVIVLWSIMRNIAYLGLIFVLLVIGIMIMFRQKINPQTVISAQAALPSLVVGLIMITFSYFLASVLIDFTFVATHLAGHILEGQIIKVEQVPNEGDPRFYQGDPNTSTIDPVENLLQNHSVLSIYNYFIDGGGQTGLDPNNVVGETQGVVNSLQSDHTLGRIIGSASFLGGCIVANQIGYQSPAQQTVDAAAAAAEFIPAEGGATKNAIEIFGSKIVNAARAVGSVISKPFIAIKNTSAGKVVSKVTKTVSSNRLLTCATGGSIVAWIASNTGVVGDLAGLVLYLVLMFALLIAMFKLLFALIGAYISILISTITAPLQFLMGSIPGKESVFTGWVKGMIANLLAFPAVFVAFLFAAYIVNWGDHPPFYMFADTGFTNSTLPLLGGLSSTFLRLVLAYGVLLAIPSIPQAIKGAMGVKDGFDFTKAALGSVGAGWGMVTQGWGGLTHRMAAERKIYENYANLVKTYGEKEAERKYGAIMRPGRLQMWAWLGLGSSVAPRGWRKYRKLDNEEIQARETARQKVAEAKQAEQSAMVARVETQPAPSPTGTTTPTEESPTAEGTALGDNLPGGQPSEPEG